MSAMKNWLMEMEEMAENFLFSMPEAEARDKFVRIYGQAQEHVFNDTLQRVEEQIEAHGRHYDQV